jgi:trigger factor
MEMMYQGGSQQDIEEAMAELRASSADEANRELKLFFVLDKYAEKFDVDVSEGEVNGRIAQMAVQSGRRPEKMRQEMARSGRLEQLFIQLREQKAIEKILEDADVTEVEGEKKADKADAEKKTTKKKTTKKKTAKKSSAKKDDDA